MAAALLDRYLARTGYASQQTDHSASGARRTNLWHAADGATEHAYGAHPSFDERSHSRSVETSRVRHPGLVLAVATEAAAAGLGAVIRHRRAR
ncbi:hypothetical protein [Streptomyces sp. NPDC001642]|uniref:hypothetical protein n=1 Tax=Streptomyces sp. NPDC001642 TaxID=3154392 RepID=UPI00387E351C